MWFDTLVQKTLAIHSGGFSHALRDQENHACQLQPYPALSTFANIVASASLLIRSFVFRLHTVTQLCLPLPLRHCFLDPLPGRAFLRPCDCAFLLTGSRAPQLEAEMTPITLNVIEWRPSTSALHCRHRFRRIWPGQYTLQAVQTLR